MRQWLRLIGAVLVALSLVLTTIACGGSAPTPTTTQAVTSTAVPTATPSLGELKVGIINPMTGSGALWGKSTSYSWQMVVDDINAGGGLLVGGKRYNIKTIIEDDMYTGAGAVSAANKLIFQDGVKFILGTLASTGFAAENPITEANKVIAWFGGATEPLAPNKRYTFSAYTAVTWMGRQFFTWLHQTYPNLTTVADIAPSDSSGRDCVVKNIEGCQAVGIQHLGAEYYERGTADFTPILTRMLAKNPTMINVSGSTDPDSGLIIKQARQLGFKGRFIQTGGATGEAVAAVCGAEAVEGTLVAGTSPWSGPLVPKAVTDWHLRYVAKYGADTYTGLCEANQHAATVLFEGIRKAGTLDTDKVVDALESITEFDTLYGKGHWGGLKEFGINHKALHPTIFSEIKDGTNVGVALVDL